MTDMSEIIERAREAHAAAFRAAEPACTLSLLDEIDRLKAELQRTERNRDMWREQVSRQAAQLEALRPTPQRGEG